MQKKRVCAYALAAVLCVQAARPMQAQDYSAEPQGVRPSPQVATDESAPTRASDAAHPIGKRTARLEEVVVEAKKPSSAASSDEIRARDYELRPHATTQEILNNAPGLVVAQHQGGGKAAQYLIRGFDADHGTDFAVFVDDLPVNLVSHAHGQGYADLNFLIPETVDRLQLYKGPYFAQFGDLANAGALNIVTKDEFKESFALAEGGSFDTQRYVLGVSPQLSWAKTLLAAQAYFSNGPFVNPQHDARYNVFTKFTLTPTPESKLALSAGIYAGDWDGSGQIPLRVVNAGVLQLDPADAAAPRFRPFGRFDSIDPFEGGTSDRENVNLHYAYTPSAQDEWAFQVYGSRYKLQLFSDFTFFKDTGLRFVKRADGSICDTAHDDCSPLTTFVPGDGIEQNDERLVYGARAKYTRYWSILDRPEQSEVAIETRNDGINLALYRQVERHRFFTVNKLAIVERSASGYMQHQVFLTDWMRFEAGLRGDVFFFRGEDRLPAGTPITNTVDGSCGDPVHPADPNFCATRIAGSRVNSIVSPKANLIITPLTDTDVYVNFGNGFHSNDARNALLSEGTKEGSAALAQSLGYEVGTRTHRFDRLDAAASLWLLDLDSELVFSGDAGNQETGANFQPSPSGASRRWGVDFETRYAFSDWLFVDYDLSYADPRFKNGNAIPLAPTLIMNGGVTAEFSSGFSAGLRLRYVGDRPALEDRSLTARGYSLLDLLAKYRWRNFEGSLALLNLSDTAWREAQFSDTSCVVSEINDSKTPNCLAHPGMQGTHSEPNPDIHFTPGNPFGVRAGGALNF